MCDWYSLPNIRQEYFICNRMVTVGYGDEVGVLGWCLWEAEGRNTNLNEVEYSFPTRGDAILRNVKPVIPGVLVARGKLV